MSSEGASIRSVRSLLAAQDRRVMKSLMRGAGEGNGSRGDGMGTRARLAVVRVRLEAILEEQGAEKARRAGVIRRMRRDSLGYRREILELRRALEELEGNATKVKE